MGVAIGGRAKTDDEPDDPHVARGGMGAMESESIELQSTLTPLTPPSFQRKPRYSTASILMNVARRSASAFVRSAGMFVMVTTQSVLIGIEEA